MRRSLLAIVMVAATFTACGDQPPSASKAAEPTTLPSTETPSEYMVAPGTRNQAQAVLDEAEMRFAAAPSARFELLMIAGDDRQVVGSGAFDLDALVGHRLFEVGGTGVESRHREGHAWIRYSGEQLGFLEKCWLHLSVGGEEAASAGLVPAGLMLLDPQAVGFVDGDDERIVVDLLLDEAAPTAIPRAVNNTGAPIDPTATIRGTITLRDGRYASVAYNYGDVLGALDQDALPDSLRELADVAGRFSVQVDYEDFGTEITVAAPAATDVIDVGDRSDVLADPAALGRLEPCSAGR